MRRGACLRYNGGMKAEIPDQIYVKTKSSWSSLPPSAFVFILYFLLPQARDKTYSKVYVWFLLPYFNVI